jgi:transposase-like protein
MAGPRVFKAEFRISIAQRILNGESVGSLSDRYKIKRSVLYRWRDLLRDQGADGFHRPRGPKPGQMKPVVGASASSEQRIAELEQRLGRLALENDFLRRAFRRVKAARSNNNASGETRCTEKSCSLRAVRDYPSRKPATRRV